jgi:ApaG protein
MPAQSPWTVLLFACGAIAVQWALTQKDGHAFSRSFLPELDLSALGSAVMAVFGSPESLVRRATQSQGSMQQPRRAPQAQPSSAAPDVQPDEVRTQSAPVAKDGPEMRCYEALPPWSMSTTHDVEIFVESHFMSGPQSEEEAAEGEEYQFKYHVEFKNNGVDTVQMLSRHWVFGDAEGRTSEVKGPGAVGKTPVLEPGGTWSYDSGTRIRTPTGSIAGSFQFEVLDDASGSGVSNFNARVARLSLTEERRPVRVPCVDEASIGQLPPTSVHSTQRVIVGVTSEAFQDEDNRGSAADGGDRFIFKYDAQINNARGEEIRIRDAYWEFSDERGTITTHRGAAYRGEEQAAATAATRGPIIAAGGAYRGPYTIGFVVMPTAVGNVEGFFTVEMMKPGGPTFADAMAVGRDLVQEGWSTLVRVRIGRMGLSVTGQPVRPIEALPNRVLQGLPADLMDVVMLDEQTAVP